MSFGIMTVGEVEERLEVARAALSAVRGMGGPRSTPSMAMEVGLISARLRKRVAELEDRLEAALVFDEEASVLAYSEHSR